ncbi:tumor necrosis factor receptor superfamily member 9a [Paralichthys olivaceus]|uniref:tumor necrosis factor receptor superfamily member 9a n=1 Tax=Paralichthys olivaceus TaxID=8255 RepID=UPI00097D9796|nr:PREDICTED: tumor necrosis factor receptor superfamily member 9-like [Paralichthys olivaceus]
MADIRMAVVLRLMGFSLLVHGCLGSVEHVNGGCMKLTRSGEKVCCEACFPGHRLVEPCGLKAKDLCTPCESGTFTVNPRVYSCNPCTQCLGAQVYKKQCTPTSDAQCGCIPGLLCGDSSCSFCIKECVRGEEPTNDRYCRPCPPGTFNDQGHQKCKPWKTCTAPYQYIEANGTMFSDIKCVKVSVELLQKPTKPDTTEPTWPLVLTVVIILALMSIVIMIIVITVTLKRVPRERRKKTQDIVTTTSINIDLPMPLRAMECSFHEAEQEQGSSSSGSLDSKDSSEQLIA